MRSWMIAFSLGVAVAALLPALPPSSLVLAGCACALLLHYWPCLRVPAAFVIGAGWLCVCADNRLAQRWPEPPFARDVWVEATVWNLPVNNGDSQRLQLRLDKVCLSAKVEACNFAQLVDDGRLVMVSVYEPLRLQPGQRWRWLLRLRPPHGFANPGGFDYEAWLFQQAISATGYVRAHADNHLLQANSGRQRLQQLRYQLSQTLTTPAATAVLHYPHLLRALTIGDGSGISDAEWQLFAATGTTHLLVISGSHVALIVLLLYAIGYWLGSRWHWLLLHMPATWPATAIAVAGAWIYTGLAGFTLPAQRAWVMAAVVLLSRLWRRQVLSWHCLVLALAVVLAWDPLSILNTGFWLSFVAVAVLLLSTGPAVSEPTWWRRWLHAVWALLQLQTRMSIALLPIVLVCFQQTSVLAPMVNLLLIPLLGTVAVPMALTGVMLALAWPAAGLWVLRATDAVLGISMQLLQWSTHLLPANMLTLPTLTSSGLVLLVVTVLLCLLARQRWQRWLAMAVLPGLFWLLQIPAQREALRVQVLDVGQGLAITVSTPRHHLLYDVGPQFSQNFDAGADVVLPVLRHANIHTLDRVMVSHSDQDHAGGLPAILRAYPDTDYSSSVLALFPPTTKRQLCRAGQHWQWDTVKFTVLHPDSAQYDDNNGSCVLLLEAAGRRVLLTGDIEKPAEALLLQHYPDLGADVLVAPHHGSRSSSTPAFVARLAPHYVVYSTGYQNRFNHPAVDVRARYQALPAREFNTAAQGAVSFSIATDGTIDVNGERQDHAHFWRKAD